MSLHEFDAETDELIWSVFRYALDRIKNQPPLDGPMTADELFDRVGQTISPQGMGGNAALAAYAEHLAPASLSADHPRYLSYVPGAPSKTAAVFDLVVGSSSTCGSSWLDGAGLIYAENQALRWLADLAGLPDEAGGCFVSGGTTANLSALVAARYTANQKRQDAGQGRPDRWAMLVADSAHSSVASAAMAMDVEVIPVPVDEQQRLRGDAVRKACQNRPDGTEIFAVVATAGTTNMGIIDALEEIGAAAQDLDLWFHIDAAYGGGALAAPSVRAQFAGIELCDSLTIDPHKWLYAPFDCAALLYRNPELARRAHTQKAGYLDGIALRDEWNPSDLAIHLTRRPRGLPFWFSLAVHGTDAYQQAIETTLTVSQQAHQLIQAAPYLEMVCPPSLSVLVFRRTGWNAKQYQEWSDDLLAREIALVVPTKVDEETVWRLCIINPLTTKDDIAVVVDALA